MTKRDLLNEYHTLCEEKGMLSGIDGVNGNSDKDTIQNAIDCLNLTDKELEEYFTVFKLKYPNSYNAIFNNGNWKTHRFNRWYVYNAVHAILQ